MDWDYVTFENGQLFDDDGDLYCERRFSSEAEAEAFLESEDLRASIR